MLKKLCIHIGNAHILIFLSTMQELIVHRHIYVNVVAPGMVATDFTRDALEHPDVKDFLVS